MVRKFLRGNWILTLELFFLSLGLLCALLFCVS